MAGMTVNSWQYGRWVYLIGRTVKYRPYTANERTAIITFIESIAATRPSLVPRLSLKYDNAIGATLAKQNSYALGKMVQQIGRNFKSLFPTLAEKELCDTLFTLTDYRRNLAYNGYVTDIEETGEVTGEEAEVTGEVTGEETGV